MKIDWRGHGTIVAMAVGAAVSAPVSAQDGDFNLENWDNDLIYDGWSAEEMLDEAEVFGSGGEEIGSVENLLIDASGQIVAVIAQVGGFWDIGDTHVAVPWEQISFNGYEISVPVTEENIDDYSMFADEYFTVADVGSLETVEDDLSTGRNIWKATSLMDDYAVLETGDGYGYINDLVFDDEGMLQAVVVDVDYAYLDPGYNGYYAYPWYGYGYDGYAWDMASDRYVLPFDENEISDFAFEFDYDELG